MSVRPYACEPLSRRGAGEFLHVYWLVHRGVGALSGSTDSFAFCGSTKGMCKKVCFALVQVLAVGSRRTVFPPSIERKEAALFIGENSPFFAGTRSCYG